MNEPPGARARVALTGLTIAEYFRDVERQDVLFFIDNIFRFTQAGSEVSALLGRIPSAVGYQPTLATDMGNLTHSQFNLKPIIPFSNHLSRINARTHYNHNEWFDHLGSSSLRSCRRP